MDKTTEQKIINWILRRHNYYASFERAWNDFGNLQSMPDNTYGKFLYDYYCSLNIYNQEEIYKETMKKFGV